MINTLSHWIDKLSGTQIAGLIVFGIIILIVSLFFIGTLLGSSAVKWGLIP